MNENQNMNAKDLNGFRHIETLSTVMLVCYILYFVCRAFDASRLVMVTLFMALAAGLVQLFIIVRNGKKLIAASKARFCWYLIASLVYTVAVGVILYESVPF